ncbi:hypothetical protein ACFLWD_03675 [Chloroflexota bacterium]
MLELKFSPEGGVCQCLETEINQWAVRVLDKTSNIIKQNGTGRYWGELGGTLCILLLIRVSQVRDLYGLLLNSPEVANTLLTNGCSL